ncbi:hypothetical protein [Haemophilus parahaemolyticus]
MILKSNHRTFRNELKAYFHKMARAEPENIETFEEVNAAQSRIYQWVYHKLLVCDWLQEAAQWKGIKRVFLDKLSEKPMKIA